MVDINFVNTIKIKERRNGTKVQFGLDGNPLTKKNMKKKK